MNWASNDLKVVEMREKIIELTNEFDQKNNPELENYQEKLNRFLNKRLRKISDQILLEHILMPIISLKVPNRRI